MKNSVKVLATLALSAFVFSAHAQTGTQTMPKEGSKAEEKMEGQKEEKMETGKMHHGKMHHVKMHKSGSKMKAKM